MAKQELKHLPNGSRGCGVWFGEKPTTAISVSLKSEQIWVLQFGVLIYFVPKSSRKALIMPAAQFPHIEMETTHEGTEHLAINNTFVRRFLTLLALNTTARFRSWNGVCIPISRHKIVKTGPFVHLTEAATMKFVSENTSIPVPKVYCSFVRKNRAYIVMERIRGDEIPRAWKKLSEESRQKMFDQLKTMVQELRALIPPPGTGVQSCVGGSLCDARIPRPKARFGPFKTIQEFHVWLREDFQPSKKDKGTSSDQDWEDIEKMVAQQDGPWPPPVFTHCDLNPFNILVREGKVVGIIDWEFAGWYPHYWEYTSAWFGNITKAGWQRELDKFIDPTPNEFKMEVTRHKYWGEW
ncbi:conserved hypothetical protein [Uncinocarpus reesii 1704]|uniref:Aminoglycoside phosphotransferase domain-containing protein n=1 Tax=Uncinocarpus reesii (strain UAMH 1704) TaxID=336963 RepID=C4JZZ2_UNCRE|nr:uncharacterized protein UREG_07743 [Uncinocarpus reesii 1704]EEP82878.1 conserved hypothetical protein [Uncinocarpus reesii 1704]